MGTTIAEMLDAANNEIQAAKKEICSPVDDRLIDALELLHAAVTYLAMGVTHGS
jgi:hypothetical protein